MKRKKILPDAFPTSLVALICLWSLISWLAVISAPTLRLLIGSQRKHLFWRQFSHDEPLAIAGIVCVLLAGALALFTHKWNWDKLWERFDRTTPLKMAAVCALCGVFLAFVMQFSAMGVAFAPDEYCVLVQSQIFAAGRLVGQVEPGVIKAMIPTVLIHDIIAVSEQKGVFSATYWPGYSLLMTPFSALGVAWLTNAVITASSLWMLYIVGAQLAGTRRGGVFAFLFGLCSPVVVLNSATYFSMPAHLLCNLIFCWLIMQNQVRFTFLAGVLGGFTTVLHNPAPHLSFVLPWIFWLAVRRTHSFGWLMLGYLLLAVPLGVGWNQHIGSFDSSVFVTDQNSAPQSGGLSELFSRIVYTFQPPTPLLLLSRVAAIFKTTIWAVPGLLVLAFGGWLLARRELTAPQTPSATATDGGLSRPEQAQYIRLLGASVVSVFFLYLFVRFDQGHGWGYRYIHHVWFAFPLLAAFFLARKNTQSDAARSDKFLKPFFLMCALGSLLVLVPLQMLHVRAFIQSILQHPHSQEVRAIEAQSQRAICFLRDDDGYYRFVLIQNDPFLRNRVWKFRYLSAEKNREIALRHLSNPQRTVTKWGEFWQEQAP